MTVWRKNLFLLPKGKTGKDFITEMIKLVQQWNSNEMYHSVASA